MEKMIESIISSVVEVRGQLTENGANSDEFKEAIRGLSEAVDMLREQAGA